MYTPITNKQLKEVANEFGTPVYVYHAEKIADQYNKLTDAFKEHPTKFFYACKALTNVNILKYMKQLGVLLDCVSINEVKLGLIAGYESSEILFTPNCVDFNEIVAAKDLGVYHRYIYQNYANITQDVFAGYGEENRERLREIQKKYDPEGVFSRLQPGYFKV